MRPCRAESLFQAQAPVDFSIFRRALLLTQCTSTSVRTTLHVSISAKAMRSSCAHSSREHLALVARLLVWSKTLVRSHHSAASPHHQPTPPPVGGPTLLA